MVGDQEVKWTEVMGLVVSHLVRGLNVEGGLVDEILHSG